jgi:periplasmic protein CpxP/Spy
MKRILVLLVVTVMSQLSFAQVKPPVSTELSKSSNADAAKGERKRHHKMDKQAKRAMMKELNLTADQKAKLKEMKEANKAKKEAILSDSKLTEEQKKEQLKEMHKGDGKNMQGVLTDVQKTKFKQLKEERKRARKS